MKECCNCSLVAFSHFCNRNAHKGTNQTIQCYRLCRLWKTKENTLLFQEKSLVFCLHLHWTEKTGKLFRKVPFLLKIKLTNMKKTWKEHCFIVEWKNDKSLTETCIKYTESWHKQSFRFSNIYANVSRQTLIHNGPWFIKGNWSRLYSSSGSKKLWAWTFLHTS